MLTLSRELTKVSKFDQGNDTHQLINASFMYTAYLQSLPPHSTISIRRFENCVYDFIRKFANYGKLRKQHMFDK